MQKTSNTVAAIPPVASVRNLATATAGSEDNMPKTKGDTERTEADGRTSSNRGDMTTRRLDRIIDSRTTSDIAGTRTLTETIDNKTENNRISDAADRLQI